MTQRRSVRVAVNSFGVIGRRVADAVHLQDDMELVGVCAVASDWRLRSLEPEGNRTLDALLEKADIIVHCTPKRVGAANVEHYRTRSIKFIAWRRKARCRGTFLRCGELFRERGRPGVNARRVLRYYLHCAYAFGLETCRPSEARPQHAASTRHRSLGKPCWRDHGHPRV